MGCCQAGRRPTASSSRLPRGKDWAGTIQKSESRGQKAEVKLEVVQWSSDQVEKGGNGKGGRKRFSGRVRRERGRGFRKSSGRVSGAPDWRFGRLRARGWVAEVARWV